MQPIEIQGLTAKIDRNSVWNFGLGVGIEAGQLQRAEHREEQPSQPGSVLAAGAEARPRHDRPRLQPLLPAGPRPAARIPAPHRPVDLRAVAQHRGRHPHRARPLHGLSEEETRPARAVRDAAGSRADPHPVDRQPPTRLLRGHPRLARPSAVTG